MSSTTDQEGCGETIDRDEGLPSNVTVPAVKIPEDQADATITLSAAGKATVGTHNIVIVGTTAIGNQQISQPAPAVTLTVAAK